MVTRRSKICVLILNCLIEHSTVTNWVDVNFERKTQVMIVMFLVPTMYMAIRHVMSLSA